MKMFNFLFKLFSLFDVNKTYDDGNLLEDVVRQVFISNQEETPFTSGIPKKKVTNTLVEWPEDDIPDATYNPILEGATLTYGTVTNPVRVNNYTQIFYRSAQVSSTQKWADHAGVKNTVAYEQMKIMKALAKDIELAALTGTKSAGDATANGRRMAGALNFCTTNYTSVASGTKLTESFYNGLLQLAWDNTGKIDEVYVPMKLKRVISSFTANGQKQYMQDSRKLVNKVEVYESDFGVQKIFYNRFMPSGTNSCSFLGIDSSKWKLGVGEPIRMLSKEEMAQTVHGENFGARGEVTLYAMNQKENVAATGLSELFPA